MPLSVTGYDGVAVGVVADRLQHVAAGIRDRYRRVAAVYEWVVVGLGRLVNRVGRVGCGYRAIVIGGVSVTLPGPETWPRFW